MDGDLAAYRYPAGDSVRAAELILTLMDDPDLWSRTGQTGRNSIAQRFSFLRMRQSLEGLYSQLC